MLNVSKNVNWQTEAYAFQNGPFQQFLSTNDILTCVLKSLVVRITAKTASIEVLFSSGHAMAEKNRQIFPFQLQVKEFFC